MNSRSSIRPTIYGHFMINGERQMNRLTPICTAALAIACVISTLAFMQGCMPIEQAASQWEYTGGPFAQNVSALLVDSKVAGVLTAGLLNGDVFESTNDGKSWIRLSVIKPRTPINRLIQDPEFWEKIYAATDSGAFISTDRGKSWTLLPIERNLNAPVPSRAIAIDPWRPNIVYAGLKGHGIYKTTDSGANWVQVVGSTDPRIALSEPYEILVDVSHPDVVFAAVTGAGLIKSTDAGLSWRRLTEEYSATSANVTCFALKDKDPATMVYGTSSGNMFRSTNGGGDWSPTRNGTGSDGILGFAISAKDPSLLYVGTETGLLVSLDFGASWLPAGNFTGLTCMLASALRGGNASLYVYGPGIGLQCSSDTAATWHRADTKLGGSSVAVICASKGGDHVCAAVRNTLLFYNEQTASWLPTGTGVPGGDITSVTLDADAAQTFYVTTPEGAFRTRDGGSTWINTMRGVRMVPEFLDQHPWITTRMFASGDQGLYVSTDKGDTWTKAKPVGGKFQVRSLTFNPNNAGIIHAASPNEGIISSMNGGINWEITRYGLTGNDIVMVTMDDRDPMLCYAWTSHGEGFRTTNRGVEWNRYAPPWKQGDTVFIAIDRYRPSSVIALINGRSIFHSPSGGTTWFPILDGEIQADVVTLYWSAKTGMLYAGTRDKGVYRIPLGPLIGRQMEE